MAHEGLWEQLEKLDGAKTAQRAKCQHLDAPPRYVITLLNTEYVVSLSDRSIFSLQPDSSQQSAQFIEQLCLLAYLINAEDLPLADKLVTAQGSRPARPSHGQTGESLWRLSRDFASDFGTVRGQTL